MKKSLEFDEHVGESTSTNPQNSSGTCKPTPDDPDQYDDSSSSESTSTAISTRKQHSRKRRSKKLIRQLFRELSAIVPEASNKEVMLMDHKEASSILEGAIKYMKQLEERVNKLEEELTRPNHGSYSEEEEEDRLLEIDLMKTDSQDQQNVFIRIICEKQKGQIARIMSEIEKLHLSVSSISALPFGDQLLVISVSAQMGNEFCMTANDLKKNLRVAILKFMRHV
ncbi:hypothetical protein RHGRI_010303 [Rhododendron griersonianum]|uniref:BHLH domain-containing protein n=1 Tax=Rhododendron griersonianum TaxID=479676 RepID=A0AAV6KIM0_9ERIC|nr:hypothetical protein RHGRI_010303 [Rhododendron griersonianum]